MLDAVRMVDLVSEEAEADNIYKVNLERVSEREIVRCVCVREEQVDYLDSQLALR